MASPRQIILTFWSALSTCSTPPTTRGWRMTFRPIWIAFGHLRPICWSDCSKCNASERCSILQRFSSSLEWIQEKFEEPQLQGGKGKLTYDLNGLWPQRLMTTTTYDHNNSWPQRTRVIVRMGDDEDAKFPIGGESLAGIRDGPTLLPSSAVHVVEFQRVVHFAHLKCHIRTIRLKSPHKKVHRSYHPRTRMIAHRLTYHFCLTSLDGVKSSNLAKFDQTLWIWAMASGRGLFWDLSCSIFCRVQSLNDGRLPPAARKWQNKRKNPAISQGSSKTWKNAKNWLMQIWFF